MKNARGGGAGGCGAGGCGSEQYVKNHGHKFKYLVSLMLLQIWIGRNVRTVFKLNL